MNEIKIKSVYITKGASCGSCGRFLTDPVSISIGIGPECIKRLRIDKIAMANALSKEGATYEYRYEEGDAEAEKFHKNISSQRIIQLDKDLGVCLKDNSSAESILKAMENGALSLEPGLEISDSRKNSLSKKLDKIKAVISGSSKHLWGGYSEMIDAMKVDMLIEGFKTMDDYEKRFNSLRRKILPGDLDSNSEYGMIKSSSVDLCCSHLTARLPYSLEFLEAVQKKLAANGMTDRSEKILTKIQEFKSKEDAHKKEITERAMKAVLQVDEAISSGSLSDLNEARKDLRYADSTGLVERLTPRRDEFVKNYTPKMISNICSNNWPKVSEEIESLISIGGRSSNSENKDYHLITYVLSNPDLILEFNKALSKEDRNWGSSLRRIYGQLKDSGLWDIITGKKKAA